MASTVVAIGLSRDSQRGVSSTRLIGLGTHGRVCPEGGSKSVPARRETVVQSGELINLGKTGRLGRITSWLQSHVGGSSESIVVEGTTGVWAADPQILLKGCTVTT